MHTQYVGAQFYRLTLIMPDHSFHTMCHIKGELNESYVLFPGTHVDVEKL